LVHTISRCHPHQDPQDQERANQGNQDQAQADLACHNHPQDPWVLLLQEEVQQALADQEDLRRLLVVLEQVVPQSLGLQEHQEPPPRLLVVLEQVGLQGLRFLQLL